ncbi:MAG: tripartite tricarboxylate transporter permease [Burkholderiales bacterium]|nr:tripartite tricarboxylate transporter permease [Burkholderiales bacterium]
MAAGVFTGILVGAIPGLNAPMAIAIAVPLTYSMDAIAGIAFLIGIMKGGTFGGSITAILLNTPGSPEATSTAFDGYPLARQGKGLKAMKMALYASVTGDTFSDIVLFTVAAPLALLALRMGPAEMTAVLMFALTIVAGLSGQSLVRGLIAAVLGAFLSTVGLDIATAEPRLTFGFVELEDGIPIIPLTIGLLALSEVLIQIERYLHADSAGRRVVDAFAQDIPRENKTVTWQEYKRCSRTIVRSSLIGTGIGALPGIGAIVAGFMSYAAAKRASKHPERFGKGELEGVAATEAANSAVSGANLIPLLAIGVPGSLSAAILIGAFLIHGVDPGPLIFKNSPQLVYGIFAIMAAGNLFNLVIGGIGLRFFALLVKVPLGMLHPIIVLLCIAGAFANGSTMFSVGIMLVFAVLGYFMRKLDFSFATFIVGFALGESFEVFFRQTVTLFADRPAELLSRPIVMAFVALTLWSLWRTSRRRGSAAA